MILVQNGMPQRPLKEAVFFAFDNHSIPWSNNLEPHLISAKPMPFPPTAIVLDAGPAGAPDSFSVHYRGSTIRVGDEFWMYYWGKDCAELHAGHTCLAKSRDGINWERPDLGLVEYKGSKHNNIISEHLKGSCLVMYEPDDPELDKRFKLLTSTTYFSGDGLHWRPSGATQQLSIGAGLGLEWGGVVKLNGMYYVTGQRGYRRFGRSWARRMNVLMSPDFINWCDTGALGYDRSSSDYGPKHEDRFHHQNEIHCGAALHDRGSVILGVYGMMCANPWGDFHRAQIDLGLMLTQDAIHYREPIPGFRFIPVGNTQHTEKLIGLFQGQGMHAVGDKTLYWYADTHDGKVRVAAWDRDRLGYLQPMIPPVTPWSLITCPFTVDRPAEARVNLKMTNAPASAFGAKCETYRAMRFEVLGADLRVIPGYSAADCLPVTEAAFDAPVTWREKRGLPTDKGAIRLRGIFDGNRPEDIRFHALYVKEK